MLINPAAGSAEPGPTSAVTEVLESRGPVSVVETAPAARDERDIRAAATSADLVAVAGGDGTINHVVNAFRDALPDVRFGLVPMGTGNDLARTLGVPTDPVEAARLVVTGSDRVVDVGLARSGDLDRLFVNACMGGFPVEVDRAIDEETKSRLGPLAFWLGGAKSAVRLSPFTAIVDGRDVEDCLALGVGNGKTCGGGFEVWPGAEPDDGMLDACALAARNVIRAARLLVNVRGGQHEQMEEVATSRGGRVELDSDPVIEINVDGELVGLTTPATFEIAGSMRVRAVAASVDAPPTGS